MIGQKEERDARCELPEASGRADESSSSCVSTPSAKWEAPQSAPKTKSAPLSEKLVRKSSSQKQSQRNKKENSPTRDKSEQPKTKPGGVDMAGTDISGDDTAPKPSQNAPVRQISDPSFSKARGKRDCCASDPPPFEETSQSNHAMKTTAKDKPKNSSPTPTLPPMSSQHQPPRPTASPPPLRSTTTSRRGGLRSGARARSPLSTTPRGVPNSFSMGSPTASNNSFAVAPSNTHDQGAARPSAELTAMKPKGNTGYNAPPQGTGNIPVNNRGTSFPDQAKQSTSGLANENSLGFTSPNKKNISSAAANAAAAASASLATMQTTPNNKNQSDEHMKLSDGSFSPRALLPRCSSGNTFQFIFSLIMVSALLFFNPGSFSSVQGNTIIKDQSNSPNAAPFSLLLNPKCTSHIEDPPFPKYGSFMKKSCKYLPEPDVVASQCPNHQLEQLIDHFDQEQNNIQRFIMFFAGPHSGHSLVGSLLDAHPMMIVANEADIFREWLNTYDNKHEKSLQRDEIFAKILSNSLKCALYTRWQHGYNYTVPGGWGGQWIHGKLAVIGDKKGGSTVSSLTSLKRKSKTKMLKVFHDFQRMIGLPIHIVHVYWDKNDRLTRQRDKLIDSLQSGPTNFSVFEWDNSIYTCGDEVNRQALLTNACKFLGVPCDSIILDMWSSMAKCKSASKHVSSGN